MQLRAIMAAGAAAMAIAAALPASAGIITAPSAGDTFIVFPALNLFGPGPETLVPGMTWTSTNATTQGGSVFGYSFGYGFGANGSSSFNVTGLNDSTNAYNLLQPDSMEFDFSTPVSEVGGVLNWYPNIGDNAQIAFYGTGGALLGSLDLLLSGVNQVAPNSFYGFTDGTADISRFVLTDGYVAVINGISVNGLPSGTPEPATWALMIGGFGLAGAALRRRKALAA
jgi:hypothetical protein